VIGIERGFERRSETEERLLESRMRIFERILLLLYSVFFPTPHCAKGRQPKEIQRTNDIVNAQSRVHRFPADLNTSDTENQARRVVYVSICFQRIEEGGLSNLCGAD
jgi:hypothetical protein